MDTIRQNASAYFRTAQILFFALLAGQILAAGVILFVLDPGFVNHTYAGESSTSSATGFSFQVRPGNPQFKSAYFTYLAPLAVIGLIGIGFYLFQIKTRAAREHAGLQEKLLAYRSAQILRWAPIEAATLIATVTYVMSGNLQFLALAGISMLVFLLQRPTKNRLVRDLDLNGQEQSVMDDPEAIVVTYSVTRN